MVRQRTLTPSCAGSNPATPISPTAIGERHLIEIWRCSQAVRHGSAKPWSSVRFRSPPYLAAIAKRVYYHLILCRCGGIGRRAGFKIPFQRWSIGSTPITGITNLPRKVFFCLENLCHKQRCSQYIFDHTRFKKVYNLAQIMEPLFLHENCMISDTRKKDPALLHPT